MKKSKLNPQSEKPTCKNDIDKVYIVEYTKLFGTPEQREIMKKCIKDHTVTKVSQLTKKPYQDIELKAVRDQFCELFFPQFNVKSGAKSFFDLVDEL